MTSPPPDHLLDEVHDLTFACLSGEAEPAVVEHLNELLSNSESARRIYAHAIRDSFNLRRWAFATELRSSEMFDAGDSDTAFQQLAVAESNAIATASSDSTSIPSSISISEDDSCGTTPHTNVPTLGLLPTPLYTSFGYLSSGWPVAYLVATVIFGIAALIGSVVYVSHPVQVARHSVPHSSSLSSLPSVVGRITGMVDCKWKEGTGSGMQDSSLSPLRSPFIRLGDKFALASGLMEITYDTGAKVILQGPVTYEADSFNGGFLSVGKLTARVEKRAEGGGRKAEEVAGGQWSVAGKSEIKNMKSEMVDSPPSALRLPPSSNPQSLIPNPSSLSPLPSPLFTVRTPTATVTDLGTEFGIDVDQTGSTTSHVFCGFVRVQAVADGDKAQDDGQLLHENQSARVEKRSDHRTIVVISSAKPAGFVRELPKLENKPAIKTLDLVDVVAGGNGFSGRRNHGIDPCTGQILGAVPSDPKRVNMKGDYTYHRVLGLPLVDGVFIPDGSRGPVQVDSAGHRFDGFEATANASCGSVAALDATPIVPSSTGVGSIRLGVIDDSAVGRGMITLHANAGITFDLDAIRKANPEFKLARFRSVARNAEPKTVEDVYVFADIRVLVDGEQRFSRRQINSTHGPFAVSVPLRENDRFLTLVATDGKDGIGWDWILFGDPRLELIPVAGKTESHLGEK